jgi:TorA maturation chaperone TorD
MAVFPLLGCRLSVEAMLEYSFQRSSDRIVDEIDRARAQEYALLATLLQRSPDARMISRLALLHGDASPLGVAHTALAEAAAQTSEVDTRQEYLELFVGLGKGGLLPYSSYYLTGTLYGRPLARLRETLRLLGIEKVGDPSDPEDHAAVLCEIMASLIETGLASPSDQRGFFEQHLAPWIGRFFVDLERSNSARFYARVGSLGRVFVDIEREVFVHFT